MPFFNDNSIEAFFSQYHTDPTHLKEGTIIHSFLSHTTGSEHVERIVPLLIEGRCPRGLVLDLNNSFLKPTDFEKLAKAVNSGSCPEGLHLNFSPYAGKHRFDY